MPIERFETQQSNPSREASATKTLQAPELLPKSDHSSANNWLRIAKRLGTPESNDESKHSKPNPSREASATKTLQAPELLPKSDHSSANNWLRIAKRLGTPESNDESKHSKPNPSREASATKTLQAPESLPKSDHAAKDGSGGDAPVRKRDPDVVNLPANEPRGFESQTRKSYRESARHVLQKAVEFQEISWWLGYT